MAYVYIPWRVPKRVDGMISCPHRNTTLCFLSSFTHFRFSLSCLPLIEFLCISNNPVSYIKLFAKWVIRLKIRSDIPDSIYTPERTAHFLGRTGWSEFQRIGLQTRNILNGREQFLRYATSYKSHRIFLIKCTKHQVEDSSGKLEETILNVEGTLVGIMLMNAIRLIISTIPVDLDN